MSSLLSSILMLIFLPFTCSLFIYVFTIYYYVFTIHYYVFTIQYSLSRIHYYVFTIRLRIYYSFYYTLCTCTMHYLLCTMHYELCTMHYALFIRIHTYSLFYTYSYVFTISRDEIP